MFEVKIPHLTDGKKIILPISMNQPLERGERLTAILNWLKENNHQKDVTILVCDYLNRFNCSDEQESLQQGQDFLQNHKEILNGFEVITWKPFIEKRKDEFDKQLDWLTKLSLSNLQFYQKMYHTFKKCFKALKHSPENSIKYQLEEYAAILCMQEFDDLIYPKKITDGLSFIYGLDTKKPNYRQISISEIKNQEKINLLTKFSLIKGQEKKRHMHIAFKGVLSQIELLLETDELSYEAKKNFVEEIENMILSHGLSEDNRQLKAIETNNR